MPLLSHKTTPRASRLLFALLLLLERSVHGAAASFEDADARGNEVQKRGNEVPKIGATMCQSARIGGPECAHRSGDRSAEHRSAGALLGC